MQFSLFCLALVVVAASATPVDRLLGDQPRFAAVIGGGGSGEVKKMVAELDAGKAGSAVSQKAASDLGTRETQPSTTGKAGSAVSQKPVALQRAQSLRAAGNKARLIQKVVKNDGTTSRIEASLVSVHLPPAAVPGDPGAVAESTFWPEPAARDAFDFKVRSSMMPRPFGICSAYDVPWAEDQCVQDRHDATSNAFYVGDHVEMGYSTGYLGNWNVAAGAEKQNVRYFVAQNAKQVSAAIKEFRAKAKNKPMIIVKNTGHDYLGRGMLSGADVGNDVLVVWTHRLQGKVYHGDVGKLGFGTPARGVNGQFEPSPKLKVCGKSYDFAVTFGSGLQLGSMFDGVEFLDAFRPSFTVGLGHMLDGGYGMWPKYTGTSADLIAQLEVVTTAGDILTVDRCTHPKLFKAFKGGGGGYGVITKVSAVLPYVLKTAGKFECEAKNLKADKSKVDKLVETLLAVPEFKSHQWGGVARVWTHGIQFWFYYHDTEIGHAKEIAKWQSVVDYAKKNGLEMTCKDVVMDPAKPGFIHDADMLVSNSGKRKWEYQSYDDYIVAFEQRYLNANELKDPAALATKFRQILEAGMDGDKKDTDKGNFIQVEISKGLFGLSPKIREEQGRFSSINPKAYDAVALLYVRSYLFHFWPKSDQTFEALSGKWTDVTAGAGLAFDDAKAIYPDHEDKVKSCGAKNMEKAKTACMRDYLIAGAQKSKDRVLQCGKKMSEVLPDAGIFMNHGAYDEQDWAKLGFGDKLYAELVRTKSEYDPDNLIRYHHMPASDGKKAAKAGVVDVELKSGAWHALVRSKGTTYAEDTWKPLTGLGPKLTMAAKAMMCEFHDFKDKQRVCSK